MTERISLIAVLSGNRKVIPVGEGKEFSSFLIGRAAEADLFLNDLTVSRRHCRIFRQAQSTMLEDLGSRAGTFLNEQKVSQPLGLRDGDEIKVGDVGLRVRIEGQKVGDGASPLPRETRRDQPDQVIPLGRGVLTIGRAPTCSIRLDHPTISRRHAEIQPVDGTFVVRDLASTNGTFLNGEALREPHHLVRGDSLKDRTLSPDLRRCVPDLEAPGGWDVHRGAEPWQGSQRPRDRAASLASPGYEPDDSPERVCGTPRGVRMR